MKVEPCNVYVVSGNVVKAVPGRRVSFPLRDLRREGGECSVSVDGLAGLRVGTEIELEVQRCRMVQSKVTQIDRMARRVWLDWPHKELPDAAWEAAAYFPDDLSQGPRMSRRLIVGNNDDALFVVEMPDEVIDAWCDGYEAGAGLSNRWDTLRVIDPDDPAQVKKAERDLSGDALERLRLLAYGLRQRPPEEP